ncbi:MAG: phosphoribosylamine--glycine ligase [bacterium]|nr:phosphoribosylamine--glycine ligase [bacterium]
MKVFVIGSDGREHALVWKAAQSPDVTEIICAPGNAGTAVEMKCLNIDVSAANLPGLIRLAKEERPDLTIVGPEAPLVDSLVDNWPKGLQIWGPNSHAASLEGSKVFAKKQMDQHSIPTARWWKFDNPESALTWLKSQSHGRWVVKADGLAAGKGVFVCVNKAETAHAIRQMSSFGTAGQRFVIEELLEGREASLFLLCGRSGQIIALETAQDYKRAYDGDTGDNTGGMGAYSPASHLTPKMVAEIIEMLRPMIEELGFTGFLYVGLMLTDSGWHILEFNVRMGDPETQPVMMRMESDLVEVLQTMACGDSYAGTLEWSDQAAVTVVMTALGYPGEYKKGAIIEGLDRARDLEESGAIKVFHAGTKINGGLTLTNGGRVLGVTALGRDIEEARSRAYEVVQMISWPGHACYRSDIAAGVEVPS